MTSGSSSGICLKTQHVRGRRVTGIDSNNEEVGSAKSDKEGGLVPSTVEGWRNRSDDAVGEDILTEGEVLCCKVYRREGRSEYDNDEEIYRRESKRKGGEEGYLYTRSSDYANSVILFSLKISQRISKIPPFPEARRALKRDRI